MKNMFRSHSKGFTLIELMVAIAIVAVLATIGYTILQTAQASSRDAKRRADMDAASQALEVNWNVATSQYPILIDSMFTGAKVPTDPIGAAPHTYNWNTINTAAASTYIICARLERGGVNSKDPAQAEVNPPAMNPPATGEAADFYCKANQQQ